MVFSTATATATATALVINTEQRRIEVGEMREMNLLAIIILAIVLFVGTGGIMQCEHDHKVELIKLEQLKSGASK